MITEKPLIRRTTNEEITSGLQNPSHFRNGASFAIFSGNLNKNVERCNEIKGVVFEREIRDGSDLYSSLIIL